MDFYFLTVFLVEQAVSRVEIPLLSGHESVSGSAQTLLDAERTFTTAEARLLVFGGGLLRGASRCQKYKYGKGELSHQRPGDDQQRSSPLKQGLLVLHVQKPAVSDVPSQHQY